MAESFHLITGASGLLGSHIAEQLTQQRERVVAVVRPTSETSFLRRLGIELRSADLLDQVALQSACQGARVVYHCAAKVGDWGIWSEFHKHSVVATRNLVRACRSAGVQRLLHVSGISVYGVLKHPSRPITETDPLEQNVPQGDHYARAKILAEEEAQLFPRCTVVRPAWFYGVRDRATIARVVKALRAGRGVLIGAGNNRLSLVHAADVARGSILAANLPQAEGRIYNLSCTVGIKQKELLDLITRHLGLAPVKRQVPYVLADGLAWAAEWLARWIHPTKPPLLTRRAVYLIGRSTVYSSARARAELGWRPQVDIREGIREALDWYLATERNPDEKV
jgi:nucleoside-diphosphate-sugar epimerase